MKTQHKFRNIKLYVLKTLTINLKFVSLSFEMPHLYLISLIHNNGVYQGQKEIAACGESRFFPLFATNFMYSLNSYV